MELQRKLKTEFGLHVEERLGDGPLLVLLHGVTRCGRDWEPIIPYLDKDWHILAFDLPGHGNSVPNKSYLVRDYGDRMIEVFQRLALGMPIYLVGHSLGAMVAADCASRSPEGLLGVVLEDPPFGTMGRKILGTAWEAQFRGMYDVAGRCHGIEEIATELPKVRIPMQDGTWKTLGDLRSKEALQWSSECLSKLAPEVLMPLMEGRWLEGYDLETIASRISCQTILIQADPTAGGALTNMDAGSFKKYAANCEHVYLPEMNHQVHRTIPQEFAGIIERIRCPLREVELADRYQVSRHSVRKSN
jgi:pimeloyl-ACP methyl ester carboxylesterase